MAAFVLAGAIIGGCAPAGSPGEAMNTPSGEQPSSDPPVASPGPATQSPGPSTEPGLPAPTQPPPQATSSSLPSRPANAGGQRTPDASAVSQPTPRKTDPVRDAATSTDQGMDERSAPD